MTNAVLFFGSQTGSMIIWKHWIVLEVDLVVHFWLAGFHLRLKNIAAVFRFHPRYTVQSDFDTIEVQNQNRPVHQACFEVDARMKIITGRVDVEEAYAEVDNGNIGKGHTERWRVFCCELIHQVKYN